MANETILIVDDHVVNLKLLSFVLSLEGFEVLTAGDAEGALQILNDRRPQLILLDIQLPGISGLDLARQLKNSEEMRDIPIVAVSANAMKDDQELAAAAGCAGYITKPIDTRTLPDAVRQYLCQPAD